MLRYCFGKSIYGLTNNDKVLNFTYTARFKKTVYKQANEHIPQNTC